MLDLGIQVSCSTWTDMLFFGLGKYLTYYGIKVKKKKLSDSKKTREPSKIPTQKLLLYTTSINGCT